MSNGIFRTAADDAAIGGRAAYSAMEFFEAVQNLNDNATIKVGTRVRFHSADGVINRDRTLRETREAFRQAILATFGKAGAEALAHTFDGVSTRPLSARMIRAVYSEAQIRSARLALDTTRGHDGRNVFEQIADDQLRVVLPNLNKMLSDEDSTLTLTDEMKAAARAVCLRDLHETFKDLVSAKGLGHQFVDGQILDALGEKARESIQSTISNLCSSISTLRSSGLDPAAVFRRADLPLAALVSSRLWEALPFLDDVKARNPHAVNVAHPERLLNEMEVRAGKVPQAKPADPADQLETAFKAMKEKIRPLVQTAVSGMDIDDDIALTVDMLRSGSSRSNDDALWTNVTRYVTRNASDALQTTLQMRVCTPEMLKEAEWTELRCRVLLNTALEAMLEEELATQLGGFLTAHPGLDRSATLTVMKSSIIHSPVWHEVLSADRPDALIAFGRAKTEIQRQAQAIMEKEDRERVARETLMNGLPGEIRTTLDAFGYGALAPLVDTRTLELSIATASPEKVQRKGRAFIDRLRLSAEALRDAPLTPEMREVLMRDLCTNRNLSAVNITFALRLQHDGRLENDCGFSQLTEQSSAADLVACFKRFGELVQSGMGDRVEADPFVREGNREVTLRLLLLLHPEATAALAHLPEEMFEDARNTFGEEQNQITYAREAMPKFTALRTEQQKADYARMTHELFAIQDAYSAIYPAICWTHPQPA